MTTEAPSTLEDVLLSYLDNVNEEIQASLALWPPDFTHIQVHEVIGGMLARQATLAKEIAAAPSTWNGHTAPILLRAMADVHINLAWLMLDPPARCLKYISFGLGQAKLELEHRRAQLEGRDPTDQEAAMMDGLEQWIDSQRATFLQDVDLGKWSGLSVRDMAREADCIDFYNYVYTPFSGCAHSMWQHVAAYNLEMCGNPLHRHHRLPMSPDLEPDVSYMLLAAKYWDKSLSVFSSTFGLDRGAPSARKRLLAAISSAADTAEAEGIEDPASENRDG
ncbi:hypothetical protein KV697_13370 [Sphingomonas sanguinis]|uniref:DUF5677 domain-containing protein n=1 Tax=Sphingomonas sanguinis TaxID=33051 RepID=UPI001C59DB30|nr:DUF5677 domain-containing protein [Sphingomonas sanguinis]QXT34771.1 hypothetical protein KV697_13370 [Sphingomonas sanguinis]